MVENSTILARKSSKLDQFRVKNPIDLEKYEFSIKISPTSARNCWKHGLFRVNREFFIQNTIISNENGYFSVGFWPFWIHSDFAKSINSECTVWKMILLISHNGGVKLPYFCLCTFFEIQYLAIFHARAPLL